MNKKVVLREILNGKREAEYIGGTLFVFVNGEPVGFNLNDKRASDEENLLTAQCYVRFRKPSTYHYKEAEEIIEKSQIKSV